jgi:hypothetical protein
MTTRSRLLLLTISGLLAFSACTVGGGSDVAQAPTATLAPIVSMTPRLTATPVASRTPLPTFTLTPSETPIPPTPSDTPTPSEVPPLMGIIESAQTVNVREGPGVSYGALTALAPGTGVEILGQSPDGAWYNIQMDDGSQGWISSSLLHVEPTQTPFPTRTPTPDLTALAQGTPLPTAILGGGTITPTPPSSARTPTPVTVAGDATEATEESSVPVIDLSSFNMTATALVGSITGGATANAIANGTSRVPVGGPTGGPVGAATPVGTRTVGAGSEGNVSSQEGVDVLAYCADSSYGSPAPSNLAAGSTIDVYWSWYAKDEALLRDHVAHVIYEVTVDGQRLQNWRLYAAPVRQQSDGNYYQYWFVPFGPLAAGPHVINYRVTWNQAISDGYDQFGPGTSNPTQTGSCTFTVR